MMKGIFPIDKFRTLQTPFYYYDTKVLRDTLSAINQEVAKYPSYSVHYAVKANANPKVMTIIRESGMGADCVSGGEIRAAIRAGFPANKVVFAGVGKADWEINLGLEYGIFCFNVESIPELEVINELAAAQNKIANVAFRINPDVGAHTHANITTGLAENKFGISMQGYGQGDRCRLGDEEREIHRPALPYRFSDIGYGRFYRALQPCE